MTCLDALLELVARGGRALAEELAEDDDLLKEEDPALLAARQNARVLFRYKERLLLQQFTLAGQLTLGGGGERARTHTQDQLRLNIYQRWRIKQSQPCPSLSVNTTALPSLTAPSLLTRS